MIHYLIIRRDLPFGHTLAQLSHAAADSMEDWLRYNTWIMCDEDGSDFDFIDWPEHGPMTVVVLGVKNNRVLLSWIRKLTKANVKHTVIREPDSPYHGDATAIGVWPGMREDLSPHFEELQTYTVFEGPVDKYV